MRGITSSMQRRLDSPTPDCFPKIRKLESRAARSLSQAGAPVREVQAWSSEGIPASGLLAVGGRSAGLREIPRGVD